MRYAILIYEKESDFDRRANEQKAEYWGAWRAFHQAMVEDGVYVGGHKLQPPATGTTVREENGKSRIQDGPFADTKEQLGGLVVVETPTLREALAWAQRCPAAKYGIVEVRPLAVGAAVAA